MNKTDQLGDLLFNINKEIKTKIERDLKPYGIGMGQLQILMLFYANPHKTFSQNEISTTLNVDKGNISRSVVKLVEHDYIMRHSESLREYQLAKKGIEFKSELMSKFIKLNNIMTLDLDSKELNQVILTLKKIALNLEEK
ncbi:MarR family transcriptional regulator [Fusibacter bizertensis]|uniref:MarR family transcriptional regulator n=1 Tax=Fusibacter bizertensis TaxID=1488331 RepID=A0ABT6NF83_9FIRM|nr:MarR family transcriptional regulator [Fusibacter bizertensis]MDH8679085.1 MarR family transcriptional regulator [Fusibacter bizertensis]